MLQTALKLAKKGFHVFPVVPNQKEPLIQGFPEKATRDPKQIHAWWVVKYPNANIGISATRFAENEALCIVDVDNKPAEGKAGLETLQQMKENGSEFPETFEHITGTGGRHLLYRCPEPIKQGVDVLGPGLDIRGKGGYVVAGGSIVAGKTYQAIEAPVAAAPQWLLNACGKPKVRELNAGKPPEEINSGRARSRAIFYLENEAPLAIQGYGGDHITFTVAAFTKDYGVDQITCLELMLDHWNKRCDPPWLPEELQQKVMNAYGYGNNPVGSSAPEKQFTIIKETEEVPPREVKKPRFTFERFKDISLKCSAASLVQGYLDQGAMTVLYGDSNSGKSFFALYLSLCISQGVNWFDRKVEKGAVVYVAAEGGSSIRNRVVAFKKANTLENEDLPFFLLPVSVDLLNPKADTDALIHSIREGAGQDGTPIRLVIIDTLSRAMAGGNENSPDAMGAFVRNLDKIRAQTSAHVLVIHHSGKDKEKGARGHSILRAATDTEIELSRSSDGVGKAQITKQRDREYGHPIGFALEVVDLGLDPHGESITSCVVRSQSLSARDDFGAFKLKGVAFDALETLRTLLLDEDKVSLQVWRTQFLDTFYRESAPSTKTSAFNRARETLMKAGRIQEGEGNVWI